MFKLRGIKRLKFTTLSNPSTCLCKQEINKRERERERKRKREPEEGREIERGIETEIKRNKEIDR